LLDSDGAGHVWPKRSAKRLRPSCARAALLRKEGEFPDVLSASPNWLSFGAAVAKGGERNGKTPGPRRRIRKMYKTLGLALLVSAISATAMADDTPPAKSAARGVKAVMCSLTSGQCTASMDGDVGNQSNCATSSTVRWDGRSPEGQNMLSLFQSAQLAGRKMYTWDQGCMGNDPKLFWAQVL
jgi:hypothetical protein